MLVLPERERTKKGAIGVETKGVTCKIPLDLHNQISEEIRETESTMSKFIEMIIREHYEKGANRIRLRVFFQLAGAFFILSERRTS